MKVRSIGPRAAPRLIDGSTHVGPCEVIGVIGKRGTGKSTAAKKMLADALDDGMRVLVFDPHDEYSRHGRESDTVKLGPLDDRTTIDELIADPEILDDDKLSLAVVPRGEPEECAQDFDALVTLVTSTADLLFAVEELGYFEEHARGRINFLATQSRHFSVPVMLVAQRIVQIPKTARTQLTQVISFRQDNPDDLRALAELAGDPFASDVSALGRGQFRHWRDTPPAAAAAPSKEKKTQ